MAQLVLWIVVALIVAGVVFGVFTLITGGDPGLEPAEPDGVAVPLPSTRPLMETDVQDVRFDVALRGYRMSQVDNALRRAAYDIGYKDELIAVLEAEVTALREGRTADADRFAATRSAAKDAKPKKIAVPLVDRDPIMLERDEPAISETRPDEVNGWTLADDSRDGAEASLEEDFGARNSR
jgi:DivIVA domain-containing protein